MKKISFYSGFRVLAIALGTFLACSSTLECHELGRVRLEHTEGKGLGYSLGYTSLDLFMAQPLCDNVLIPFVDLRGHVFNNGRFATNAGLGLRWFDPCCEQLWGIHLFYDSHLTRRLPYHQVSLGLEMLGESWEVHFNGYLPVGHKKTNLYFIGYNLFRNGFLCKAKEQFAMGGLDLELGYHFCTMQCFDMYLGFGPYFYRGTSEKTKNAFRSTTKNLVGGRFRASVSLMQCLELEGVTTYDTRFKWAGQVILSINLPFDWNCGFGTPINESCGLRERFFQPVIRNEIIVIDRINRFSSNPEILDPEFEP